MAAPNNTKDNEEVNDFCCKHNCAVDVIFQCWRSVSFSTLSSCYSQLSLYSTEIPYFFQIKALLYLLQNVVYFNPYNTFLGRKLILRVKFLIKNPL